MAGLSPILELCEDRRIARMLRDMRLVQALLALRKRPQGEATPDALPSRAGGERAEQRVPQFRARDRMGH